MGGFPSLPSASNPYASAAASAGSGAANLAAALREAATQQDALKARQAQQQQTQQHQAYVDQLDLLKMGGVPAEVVAPADPNHPDGLKTRSPNPNLPTGADPSRIVTDPTTGKKTYIPTAAEKKKSDEALDDSNSFALSPTAAQAMNEAGYQDVKPGQRIPMAHAATVTQAVKDHLNKTALDDSNSVEITQGMADKLAPHGIKLKPGARVSLEKANDLKTLVEMAEPPDKSKPPRTKTDLEHFSSPVSVNEDTGKVTALTLPPGVKAQATPGQQEADQRFREREQDRKDARDQRQQDQEQKAQDGAQKTVDQLQTREQEQHAKRQAYGTVLGTKDGDPVVDPDDKKLYTMNGTRRKYYQDRYDKATQLAGAYNAQAKKIVTRFGGDTGEPATNRSTKQQTDQPAADAPKTAKTAPSSATKPATKPATNGQQTGKKSADIGKVRAYAQQKGVPEAQALREFQQYGYAIGGH